MQCESGVRGLLRNQVTGFLCDPNTGLVDAGALVSDVWREVFAKDKLIFGDPEPKEAGAIRCIEPIASGAFASMAAWATGQGESSHSPTTRAAQLLEAVALLRQHDQPAACYLADALDRWLREGGDLLKILGLRPRRGGAAETPQRSLRKAKRNALIRGVSNSLVGTLKMRAEAIAQMVRDKHPAVLVLREHSDVPTSPRQIVRILRAPTAR